MLLPDIRNILIAATLGLLAGSLGSWYLTAEYKDAKWGEAVESQKVAAGKTLQGETEKVLAAEREVTKLKDKLEKQHAELSRNTDRTLADNRRLAAQLGGLRDPGRRSSGSCPEAGAASSTPVDSGATSGSQLSGEASTFLLEFAADADRVADYALTCYLWANRPVSTAPAAEDALVRSP